MIFHMYPKKYGILPSAPMGIHSLYLKWSTVTKADIENCSKFVHNRSVTVTLARAPLWKRQRKQRYWHSAYLECTRGTMLDCRSGVTNLQLLSLRLSCVPRTALQMHQSAELSLCW